MATLIEEVRRFRASLMRDDAAALADLVRSYEIVTHRLEREAERIRKRLAALPKGERSEDLLRREGRIARLETQANAAFASWLGRSGRGEDRIRAAVEKTLEAGRRAASDLVDEVTPDGFTPELPTEAIEEITATTRSGPLHSLLERAADEGSERVIEALTKGVALGKNPRTIAREIRDAGRVPLDRALRIARTEQLRAYRQSSLEIFRENTEVVDGWVWICALDERSCASCIAQHGRVYDLSVDMATHPNCRCTQAPFVPGVDYGQTGEEWFDQQDEETQRGILGKKALEEFQDGNVQLSDFVAFRQNAVWGATTRQASLREALSQAGRQTARNLGRDLATVSREELEQSLRGDDPLERETSQTRKKTISETLVEEFPDADLWVEDLGEGIRVSKIVVPENLRGEGLGTRVMERIHQEADRRGVPVVLTPDPAFGGDVELLEQWYARLGYKPNRGGSKDFRFTDTLIREPRG